MKLKAEHEMSSLFLVSQLPMILLLLIFLRIPDLPQSYRIFAIITIIIEAAIMFELIGTIIQRVKVTDKGIRLRRVFERQTITWETIKGLRINLISPMEQGRLRSPTRLTLIKLKKGTTAPPSIRDAQQWWNKKKPSRRGIRSIGGLLEAYENFIEEKLKGWYILWETRTVEPLENEEEEQEDLFEQSEDHREERFLRELDHQAPKHIRDELQLINNSYPWYIRTNGGKYAQDKEHLWDTLE